MKISLKEGHILYVIHEHFKKIKQYKWLILIYCAYAPNNKSLIFLLVFINRSNLQFTVILQYCRHVPYCYFIILWILKSTYFALTLIHILNFDDYKGILFSHHLCSETFEFLNTETPVPAVCSFWLRYSFNIPAPLRIPTSHGPRP